jgi:PEP-CTERM/exosortase A-associated glycosyltransferase
MLSACPRSIEERLEEVEQRSCGVLKTELTMADKAQASAAPIRVLHVLDHSWPVLSGYSVRSQGLIQGQRHIRFDPQVLTGPLHQLDDHAAQSAFIEGVLYRRTPLPEGLARRALERQWPIIREAAVVRLLRRQILETLARDRVHLVHAHSPALCGLAALQAARVAQLPFVYEIRAFWEDAAVDQAKTRQHGIRYTATRRLETYVARHADAVVGIARHILRDLEARGLDAQKLFYVPNGVDVDRHYPVPVDRQLREQLGLANAVVLGFVGSLYRYEGISWLVPAFAELRKQGFNCKLLILGDGEDMPSLKAATEKHRITAHVLAVGRVAHEQVARYYSAMDILVYPRLRNRLTELVTPLKPLEAMAQGKPVLASRVGGIQELVEDGTTALLFDPGNVEDFCRQARRLLEQPALCKELAQQGREMVLRKMDWKVLAGSYAGVYDYAFLSAGQRNRSRHNLTQA